MKLLFTALVLSALVSCTITKRVHTKGWHIEWRHSLNRTTALSENETDLSSVEQSEVSHQEDSLIRSADTYRADTREMVSNSLANDEEIDSEIKGHEAPVGIIQEVKPTFVHIDETDAENLENNSQRQEPLGVVSIFFSSAAILLFIHICLLLTDNGWVALFGMSYPGLFLLAISLAVIALILAINSLRKINKSPTTLKGKKLAWTGMGMSIGANGLFLVLLVGIGLYFLFENFFGF